MGKQLNSLMFKFESAGDQVQGVITSVEKDWQIPNGGTCDRYHLLSDVGISYSFILGTATDKSLSEINLEGKHINVLFKGKFEIPGGRSVNQFIVTEVDEPKKSKKE
jgi:hypothetical protein